LLAEPIREQFNRVLAGDPYDWELRLERAWFDLAFSTNAARALFEARQVVKLNPLQAQIPLRFARHYAWDDRETAWEFLRAGRPYPDKYFSEALDLAWQIRGDTASLWSLTPNRADSLWLLGNFAQDHKLFPLAARAYQLLSNRVDSLILAQKFLEIQRPDLTLALLGQSSSGPREKLLNAKAHLQMGNYSEAIRQAESIWQSGKARQTLLVTRQAGLDVSGPLKRWKENPQNPTLALELAESISQAPPEKRDLSLLNELATQFSDELRLAFLVFQTELGRKNYQAAAEASVALAERVVSRR
jgi:hypothetical protein